MVPLYTSYPALFKGRSKDSICTAVCDMVHIKLVSDLFFA